MFVTATILVSKVFARVVIVREVIGLLVLMTGLEQDHKQALFLLSVPQLGKIQLCFIWLSEKMCFTALEKLLQMQVVVKVLKK